MANVNQIITLGIGTPSDIAHLVLFGLTPLDLGAPTPATVTLAGWYQSAITVPGRYQDTITSAGFYQGTIPVPGSLE